jgi:AraC-like DNA-binding protein
VACLKQVAEIVPSADGDTAARLSEVATALVAAALGERLGRMPAAPSWPRASLLYRAKAAIDAALGEPELGTPLLAKRLAVSPRYLQMLFQQEGTTVARWIWQRRLERCREELANRRLAGRSIGEIAFAAGFADLAHFSRRFKAAFGLSPREFRRLAPEVGVVQARATKLSSKE